MKVIFGTTNRRKLKDLFDIINEKGYDIEVLTLKDIGWDLGDIEENGETLEDNSLIKARAIREFCFNNGIDYPILTDDSGLFVKSLNWEPGVYTARYAEDEINHNPNLPVWEGVNKVLRKLNGQKDRSAYFRCCVTCMYSDGSYFQESGMTTGTIAEEMANPIIMPYYYTIFILDEYNKYMNNLVGDELKASHRYQALDNVLDLVYRKKD